MANTIEIKPPLKSTDNVADFTGTNHKSKL